MSTVEKYISILNSMAENQINAVLISRQDTCYPFNIAHPECFSTDSVHVLRFGYR